MKYLLIALLIITPCSASHIVGGELGYKCLGSNDYKIVLNLYRDTSGISAPNSVYIDITSSCSSTFIIMPPVITIPVPAPYPIIGIEQWVYEGIVTIPPCSDWVLTYTICCRNGATTLINPTANTMLLEATLDNSASCNSTPVFNSLPVPFLCLNELYCIDNLATDPDGDSLSYELIPAGQVGGPVTYAPGYDELNPVDNSLYSFDTTDGAICIRPTALQIGVLAVLVREWRGGQVIGSVVRDLQLIVVNCEPFALPVTWGWIKATHQKPVVKLHWQTLSEKNCNYFEVLRLRDNWQQAALVQGSGTTTEPNEYQYIDRNPSNYYMIKQFDYNGNSTASNMIYVNTGEKQNCIYFNSLGQVSRKQKRGYYFKYCEQ